MIIFHFVIHSNSQILIIGLQKMRSLLENQTDFDSDSNNQPIKSQQKTNKKYLKKNQRSLAQFEYTPKDKSKQIQQQYRIQFKKKGSHNQKNSNNNNNNNRQQPKAIPKDDNQEQITQVPPSIFDNRNCCRSLVPFTFADTINYQTKHLELLEIQMFKKKQHIIEFITKNNKENYGIKNCKLLNLIQSDSFWEVVIIQMIHDIIENSQKIAAGRLQMNVSGYIGSTRINRFYAYIFLCQMFFGLIPLNLHNKYKQSQQKISYPTFGKIFERLPNNKLNEQQQSLDEIQLENMNKIKSLMFYFSSMVDLENRKKAKASTITIQRQKHFIQQDLFYNYGNTTTASEHFEKLAISEQDYGPLGDEKLVNFKFTIEDKFNYGEAFVRIAEIDTLIDEPHNNKQQQKLLTTSFYGYPELFILKVICCNLDKNQCIGVYGCQQYLKCLYEQIFQCICKYQPQQDQTVTKFSLILINKPKQRLNIKRYHFKHLKQKLQNYICLLNLASKNQNLHKNRNKLAQKIKIPFCFLTHQDPYLNFLLMWMAISLSKLKNHSNLVISLNDSPQGEKPDIYTFKKIIQEMKGKQVGDIMAIIRGYRQYEARYSNMNNSKKSGQLVGLQVEQIETICQYKFIQYLKRMAI